MRWEVLCENLPRSDKLWNPGVLLELQDLVSPECQQPAKSMPPAHTSTNTCSNPDCCRAVAAVSNKGYRVVHTSDETQGPLMAFLVTCLEASSVSICPFAAVMLRLASLLLLRLGERLCELHEGSKRMCFVKSHLLLVITAASSNNCLALPIITVN